MISGTRNLIPYTVLSCFLKEILLLCTQTFDSIYIYFSRRFLTSKKFFLIYHFFWFGLKKDIAVLKFHHGICPLHFLNVHVRNLYLLVETPLTLIVCIFHLIFLKESQQFSTIYMREKFRRFTYSFSIIFIINTYISCMKFVLKISCKIGGQSEL